MGARRTELLFDLFLVLTERRSSGEIFKSSHAKMRSVAMAPALLARFAYSCARSKSCSTKAITSISSLFTADDWAESKLASRSSELSSLSIARDATSEVTEVRSGGGGAWMSGTGEES